MSHNRNTKYLDNKRIVYRRDPISDKPTQENECYLFYEEGKGKRKGHLGKFIMQDDDGNEFRCPPGKGYNYRDMRNMLKDIHGYIGARATFTYFQRTKAGSYRHPLFKAIRNYE